ncbi:MAG: hypothetical protein OQK35_01260 [Alphaproteobacteria bacterium]|nr:hypothetical protein [Rhodospirillales bacterium]MCW9044938.1 hypothetical protein [Alphaproteobacteria bacterium]
MSKKIAQVKKRETKDWILGNKRMVLVLYNMIPLEASWKTANPIKGELLCAYKYDGADTEIKYAAKAIEISMNGTKLSRHQIDNLNIMVTLIGQGL